MSLGFVALGAMALGYEVVGGLVFGWDAHGLAAAGYSGRGLIDAWIAHPDPSAAPEPTAPVLPGALLVSVVGVVLSLTLVAAAWGRLCRTEAERALLRQLTRFWMPLAFSLPVVLHLCGVRLNLLAWILLLMATTLLFGLWFRRRVRATLPDSQPR
jgi:hypothetical protein